MFDRVYLDWNATTPLRPEARQAMAAAWEIAGNPSSVHAEGRQARRLIEDARAASTRRRASRPSACTEDGLPTRSYAATIAARASGRSGVVAFQSR